MKRNFWSFLSALAMTALLVPIVGAAEPSSKSKAKSKADKAEFVEMFQAIEDGKIEVNFYPKDATQATIVLKNKSDEAINVGVPKAFGAVHVLGQMGGMGGMGGGMGGMGGGMGGGGMGGMFRIEPDKSRKVKVPCVCLEHGKQDPNPRMKYKIVPIETVNSDPRVSKLCELLADGKAPQNTIQAAAWNLANGLSWEELSHKNRVESRYTGNVRFFNPVELRGAFQISTLIRREYDRYLSATESTGAIEEDVETEETLSESSD